MRRRPQHHPHLNAPLVIMTHEPDYHAVPGEEGMEEGVPSSFYGEQGEKSKKRSRLLRRSYVFRRRLAVCSFVMAGTLLSLFIAVKRGHLLRKFHSKYVTRHGRAQLLHLVKFLVFKAFLGHFPR